MTARELLGGLRRNYRYLVGGLLGALLVSFGVLTVLVPKPPTRFGTEQALAVGPDSEIQDTTVIVDLADILSRQGFTGTLAELLVNDATHRDAFTAAELDVEAADLRIDAHQIPSSTMAVLRVDGTDRTVVAAAAKAIWEQAASRFTALYPVYDVSAVGTAPTPSELAPRPDLVIVAAAGLLGLLAGAAVGLGVDRREDDDVFEQPPPRVKQNTEKKRPTEGGARLNGLRRLRSSSDDDEIVSVTQRLALADETPDPVPPPQDNGSPEWP